MMTKRMDDAKPKSNTWSRYPLASTMISAAFLIVSADTIKAADIYPGKVVGRVAFDSSQICTFWTGLGTDQYLYVSDEYGDPLPMSLWQDYAYPDELADLFDTLYGFAWITSKSGLAWLSSPQGFAWRNSDAGKDWIAASVRTASTSVASAPVEYVKICSLYGAGFYYIPGTETCLRVGSYIRSQVSANGEPADYGELNTYLNRQFTQFSGFTFGKSSSFFDRSTSQSSTPGDSGFKPLNPAEGDDPLKNFAEIISGKGVPNAPKEAQTTSPSTAAPGADSEWAPRFRMQRSFNSDAPSAKTSPSPPDKGGAKPSQTASQQKGPAAKGGKAQDAQSDDQGVKIHFKVNLAMLDKSELGPPVAGEHVQLMPSGDEPALPSKEARTADVENAAHNQDPARCVTNASGTCTTRLQQGAETDYGFPKYQPGLRLNLEYKESTAPADDKLQGWQVGLNYTAQLNVSTYASYVAETNPQAQKPDFSQLNSDGLTFRESNFKIGGMDYTQVDAISLGTDRTRDLIDQLVRERAAKLDQLGVKVVFEGNICRLELPGPWIEDMKSATRRGGGIPTANISLRTDRPKGASR